MNQEGKKYSNKEKELIKDLRDKKVIQKLNNFQSMYLIDLLGLNKDHHPSTNFGQMNNSQLNSNDLEEDIRNDNEAQKDLYW